MLTSFIRRPHSTANGYRATDVAKAYNLPAGDGAGATIGIIELGGAYNSSDVTSMGLSTTNIVAVNVGGASQSPDGPSGADGEVMLDVEVVAQVAPAAKIRVYFCANTDSGFEQAVTQAASECDIISISWGSPEDSWAASSIKQFSSIFAAARARGVTVFAASGDNGSKDGTSANVTDYPASDPNVVGCGGTSLTLNPDGSRASEVAWDDNPTTSASGGGVSKVFPGRNVPDVAGNADPQTGYSTVVDGQSGVVGGTSAVAPLYAAMTAVVKQLHGKGTWDFLNVVLTNPALCFDVTQGNNGGYKAGPGRDEVTGFGVVDFGKLLALLNSGVQVPTPGGSPNPVPKPDPDVQFETWLRQAITYTDQWLRGHGH